MIDYLEARYTDELGADAIWHNHALIAAYVQMPSDNQMITKPKERLALWTVHDIVN